MIHKLDYKEFNLNHNHEHNLSVDLASIALMTAGSLMYVLVHGFIHRFFSGSDARRADGLHLLVPPPPPRELPPVTRSGNRVFFVQFPAPTASSRRYTI
ncbi:hypothetical protein DCAR_0416850 [Daucus carota subsp. sativus]|uniref:Uncharacterized protein n=1 Tax=Daucus carota subsp. sativus TaxID=79200 RepID=A0A165XUG7_DAUCS|nr:hypothetical protein DCAR_0416850 [Daucus carota subsp. sativus]